MRKQNKQKGQNMYYIVENNKSALVLGVKNGHGRLWAYQQILIDAGYSPDNLPPGSDDWDSIPDDITVHAVDSQDVADDVNHELRRLGVQSGTGSAISDPEIFCAPDGSGLSAVICDGHSTHVITNHLAVLSALSALEGSDQIPVTTDHWQGVWDSICDSDE